MTMRDPVDPQLPDFATVRPFPAPGTQVPAGIAALIDAYGDARANYEHDRGALKLHQKVEITRKALNLLIVVASAPLLVTSWIDGLTDTELLSLRFNPGADWCQQMRSELRRLAEGGAA